MENKLRKTLDYLRGIVVNHNLNEASREFIITKLVELDAHIVACIKTARFLEQDLENAEEELESLENNLSYMPDVYEVCVEALKELDSINHRNLSVGDGIHYDNAVHLLSVFKYDSEDLYKRLVRLRELREKVQLKMKMGRFYVNVQPKV